MDWFKMKAVEYGLSFVIGPLAMLVMQLLKQGVAVVDQLPTWQKRGVVVFLAAVFTVLGQVLGVNFGVTPDDISGLAVLEQDTIKAALAAAVAMGLHALKKAAKPTP